jgi:hypothetical protein
MDFTSKILNVNFIILIKSFFNLVNLKFKICGCDKTTLLNRNLVPRFLGTEKKKKQGTVRTE